MSNVPETLAHDEAIRAVALNAAVELLDTDGSLNADKFSNAIVGAERFRQYIQDGNANA